MHTPSLLSYSVAELYDTPLAQESPSTANLKGRLHTEVGLLEAWQASGSNREGPNAPEKQGNQNKWCGR